MSIDLTKMNKAEVLAALYNRSHVQGLGFLQAEPGKMNVEEAEELLKETSYFDYLKGKVMKIRLNSNTLTTWGYNRDCGERAAEGILSGLEGYAEIEEED